MQCQGGCAMRDAMETWTIKVEPEDQVDATENAEPAENTIVKSEVDDGMFESVIIKLEPEIDRRGSKEDGNILTVPIDIEEHPVKLEEEQSDALICCLPAPATEISDQDKPCNIDGVKTSSNNKTTNKSPTQLSSKECSSDLFKNKKSLIKYQPRKQKQKFLCKVCGIFYSTPNNLERHQATHSFKFKYDDCHSKLATQCALEKHQQLACNNQPISAAASLQKGATTSVDKTKSDPLKQQLSCDKCLDKFSNANLLFEHQQMKHKQTFPCKICGFSYVSASKLEQHQATHSPKYKCGVCHSKYFSQAALEKHQLLACTRQTSTAQGGATTSTDNKKIQSKPPKGQVSSDKGSTVSATKKALTQKEKIKNGQRFACKICGIFYFSASKLEKHQTTHILKYECDFCHSKYYTKNALEKHQELSTKCQTFATSLQCKICTEKFDTQDKLNYHFKLCYEKEKLTCKICKRVYTSPGILKSHLHSHDELPRYDCSQCQKKFRSYTGLKKHLLLQHGQKMVTDSDGNVTYVAAPIQKQRCTVCSKLLISKFSLYNHMKMVHSKIDKFVCKICGKNFNYHALLKRHMFSHNEGIGELLECPLCKYKFKLQPFLFSHIKKVHLMHIKSNEKLQKFMLSVKDFRNHNDKQGLLNILNEISATYQAPKMYHCGICSSTHATRLNLARHKAMFHVQYQSRYTEYHCNECGETLTTRVKLTNHIERHIKPYECKVCGVRLGSSGLLKCHRYQHNNISEYACDFCQRKFSNRALLYQHMKFVELRLENKYKKSETARKKVVSHYK